MRWIFGHREVRGWGCNGLFDEDDNMILGDDTGWSGGFVMPSETHQRQIEAVPEMLELLQKLAHAYDASQGITQRDDLFLDLSIAAEQLLSTIEKEDRHNAA